jgi:NAD+ kinase
VRLGIVMNPGLDEARTLALQVQAVATRLGVSNWRSSADEVACEQVDLQDTDLLLVMGGDGTILRVARVAARYQVPVMGVGFGRLGFLAEVSPAGLINRIEDIVAQRFWVEKRLMIRATVHRRDRVDGPFDVLNDVVAGRGTLARVVDTTLLVDGEYVTTFVGDGVIVSTPTGSTAYSLAAGGPILDPGLNNMVVTPIAPHLSFLRSLVLPESATIELSVASKVDASLSIDGQVDLSLGRTDTVQITKSPLASRFARIHPKNYFYRSLSQRLRRWERTRFAAEETK